MGKKRTGVEIHKGRVRISFKWPKVNGKRIYESTDEKPNAAGLDRAAKLRDTVIKAIEYDRFSFAEYFPDSKRASNDSVSFYDFAKKFIAKKEAEISSTTVDEYRKVINFYWLPAFGQSNIRMIGTGEVQDAIFEANLGAVSKKSYNNILTPLRGIFSLAVDYEVISSNPCDRIKNLKHQAPPPDPLDVDEMQAVLNSVRPDWKTYFQVAFGTGMRTSELIALRWQDIDFRQNTITVQRGFVRKRTKDTKTHRVRTVKLNGLSLAGLKAQKAVTFLADEVVFTNPNTGRSIPDDKTPRVIWNAALKKAGIRHRKAYSTRDTFASIALSSGKNPYMVADTLGNSVTILMKHYAKYIQLADDGMDDLFASKSASKYSDTGGI